MLRAALVLALSLALPATAFAGTPGTWTRVHTGNDARAEPGLARTPDGALHLVWQRSSGILREDVVHQAISPAGALLGSPTLVAQGWQAINPHVDLAVAGSQLRAFWAGATAGALAGPIVVGSSTNGGSSWGAPAAVTSAPTAAAASGLGAVVTPAGTIAAAHGDASPGSNLVRVAAGTEAPYESSCCAYRPDIAVDAVSGELVVGWFSTATGRAGLWTQTVAASGLVGARAQVPGSSAGLSAVDPSQRTAITGRLGAPGVYVGYGSGVPAFETVNVLRVGGTPVVVARASGIEHVGIAPAPEGRLWLFWSQGETYVATRSNRAVTRFGTVTRIKPPEAGGRTHGLFGEGSRGPLDLVAHAGNESAVPDWHTQVLPRLSLVVLSSRTVSRGTGKRRKPFRRLTLRVTDAGDPLAGARITLAGRTFTTNSGGRVTAMLPARDKRLEARATRTGYAPSAARIRV